MNSGETLVCSNTNLSHFEETFKLFGTNVKICKFVV